MGPHSRIWPYCRTLTVGTSVGHDPLNEVELKAQRREVALRAVMAAFVANDGSRGGSVTARGNTERRASTVAAAQAPARWTIPAGALGEVHPPQAACRRRAVQGATPMERSRGPSRSSVRTFDLVPDTAGTAISAVLPTGLSSTSLASSLMQVREPVFDNETEHLFIPQVHVADRAR